MSLLISGKDPATGSEVPLKVSSDGTLVTSGGSGSSSASVARTTALAASLVAKASAGNLLGVYGINTSGSDLYIQIHDATSLPSDTAVPKDIVKAFAGENFFFEPAAPIPYATGITVCNSTTLATKTIDGANCWFTVEYS